MTTPPTTITLPPTTAPTTQEIYDSSKLNWRRLGIADASDLNEPWLEALAYLGVLTGRYYDDWPAPNPAEFPGAQPMSATPGLVPLMRQVTRMRVEQIVMQKQPGYVDTATDDLISSFSVGSYSETRRDLAAVPGKGKLNSWPALNSLLWGCMTPDRVDYWNAELTGVNQPAFAVEEVDWSLIGRHWYSAGDMTSPYATMAAFNPYAPWTMWI